MLRLNNLFQIHCTLIFLLIWRQTAIGASNFVFNFTRLDCRPDQPGLISILDCRIENMLLPGLTRKVIAAMNAEIAFSRPPKPHFYARTIGRIKPKVGELSTILDVRLDICEFLQNKFTSKMFSVLSKIVLEYINFRPECPLKTNFTYSSRNFRFNPDDFPSYVPEAVFMLEFDFMEREVQFGHAHMWIEVIAEKKRKYGGGKRKRRRH